MTNITLIIFLLSLISISLAGSKHGEACTKDSDCVRGLFCVIKYNGTTHYDYRCGCKTGYGFNQQSSNCTSFDSYRCTTDDQCQDNDRYRICNQSKCVCKDKYQESTEKKCTIIKGGHLKSCDKNDECKSNLYCHSQKKKCLCETGFLWSKTYDDCKSINSYECGQDSDCQERDPNRICSQNHDKCVCKDGYEAYFSNEICMKKLNSHNESCKEDRECMRGLKCYDVGFGKKKCLCQPFDLWIDSKKDSSKGCYPQNSNKCERDSQCQDHDQNRLCLEDYCKCRPDYTVFSNDTCEKKLAYREACTRSNVMSPCQSNLTCSNHLCLCTHGYFWSDKEQRCKPFQDGGCTNDTQCQDNDNQRMCDLTNGKCVCKQGMFEDSKKMCRKQVALGLACNNTNECATTNSICYKATCNAPTGLCVCKPTHRRNETFCVTRTCTQNSDCYSNIFDEDNYFICNGNGQCNCQTGYTIDLIDGQCKYVSSHQR